MQKANIIPAIVTSFGSAFARFLDLRLAVGNVTNTGDLVDGIVFDTNTNLPTAFALTALTAAKIEDIINTLSDEATGNVVMIGNRKVKSQIGNLENGAGNREFPGYLQGASLSPYGVPFILNSKIPSVLDVGGDARTGGTDDVLICADMSQVIAGISGSPRIDMSEHFRFTNDVTTIRGITRYGAKVLSSATGAGKGGGIVAVAQELTNA